MKRKLETSSGDHVAHANPLGNALALIIGTAADVLTALMQATIALVFDLCLVGLMIGAEALGHVPASAGSANAASQSGHAAPSPPSAIVVDTDPLQGKLLPAPRPKLVAANVEPSAGSIPKIMTAALEPAAGKRVELEEAFGAYAGACAAEGKRAVPPSKFVDPLRVFCRGAGISIKEDANHVYLMNVRLAGNVP